MPSSRVIARPALPLQAGSCRIELTREEREILHLAIAVLQETPEVLVGEDVRSDLARVALGHLARIQRKLPRRFSGTYGD